MPTELGEPFDVTWRGKPQQMLQADIPVWWAFLDKYANTFQRFYYNVKVGGPDISKISSDPKLAKMWYDSTAKRIDAIGEKQQQIWIIEVSAAPFIRAVGQCLSYSFLWSEDPKINKPALTKLVCYRIDDDCRRVLNYHGIEVIKVEPPTP